MSRLSPVPRCAWFAALVAVSLCAGPTIWADEPSSPEVIELTVADSWAIKHATHHVQGLCASNDAFWISSVDRAARRGWVYRIVRSTGQVAVERDVTDGAQIHPGGMQRIGDELWVALAEYRPRSHGTVLRLDAKTLEPRGAFPVDDHIGAVATDGQTRVYAVNWDSRTFYTFDLDGKLVDQKPSANGVAYQDIEWHHGRLWCVGRTKIDAADRAVVDVLAPERWKLERRYVLTGAPQTGGTFGREGFCKFGDDLYVAPEDGPNTTVYRFPLPVD